jgi:polar amino acid transport system substrate-binding protein
MRRLFHALALLALLAATAARSEPAVITLASDAWPRYVDASGGYLVEVCKAVFAAHGYRVQVKITPFTRATALVQSGAADVVPALYREPDRGVLFAGDYTAIDETAVLINTSRIKWDGRLRALNGKTVGWIRGFNYAPELARTYQLHVDAYEVNDRQTALAMLRQGRLDAVMDNAEELASLARQQHMAAPDFVIASVFRKPLYFGFADTPRGRMLRALFDHEIARMKTSGRLAALYRQLVPGGPDLAGPVTR